MNAELIQRVRKAVRSEIIRRIIADACRDAVEYLSRFQAGRGAE